MNRYCFLLFNQFTFIGQQALFSSFFSFKADDYCVEKTNFHPIDGHECYKADQPYSIHCHECDKADQLYSIHCHEYVDIVLKSSLLKCFLFNYINLNTKIL